MTKQTSQASISTIGIDIGKNSFHVIGFDDRGAIVLRQKLSRGQIAVRFSNLPVCLIGMEACVGSHHLSRRLRALGHDVRIMPALYVKPYLKGQKNDFRDAEAIAEAVQRPTMRFVPTKTVERRFSWSGDLPCARVPIRCAARCLRYWPILAMNYRPG